MNQPGLEIFEWASDADEPAHYGYGNLPEWHVIHVDLMHDAGSLVHVRHRGLIDGSAWPPG